MILDGCTAVYDSGKYYIRCPCGDLIHVGHRDRRSKVDRNNSSSKPRLNFDWKLLNNHLHGGCPMVKMHLAKVEIDMKAQLWMQFLEYHGRLRQVGVEVSTEGELQLTCLKDGCSFLCPASISFGFESKSNRFHMECYDNHVCSSRHEPEVEAPPANAMPEECRHLARAQVFSIPAK